MPTPRPVRPVISYPRDAVVDRHQLAAALGVSVGIAMTMDLPSFMAGGRERWVWGQVLDVLCERALPTAGPHERATAERSIRRRR
jgi:hypothetical protein